MKIPTGNIIWLASYPKSGNTWFRAFYTNLIQNKDAPVNLNELGPRYMAASRSLFDDYTGIESSDLSRNEIEQLRPLVYETISRVEGKNGNPIYMKIHDAFTVTDEGKPIVSLEATEGAIYFLRNPLDVAVSFAHHSACDIDTIIERMADKSYCFCPWPNRLVNQFSQWLSSWSTHVTSWVEGLEGRLHLMRYEDMVLKPLETFTDAVRFAQLPDNPARIQKALIFSNIKKMQEQEKSFGFKEKYYKAKNFFRKGEIGSWRKVLTDRQVQRIIHDHHIVMKRFGYLNDKYEPLF